MSHVLRLWSATIFVLLLASPLLAGPASDTLLPRSTKGYVSVARPKEFKDRWKQTQFGQLLDDELMQPFIDDFREQLNDKYRVVENKLGITWDDLEGVPAGELSLSLIERKDADAALAITIDVTNHDQQAAKLLAAVEKRFADRGGRKETVDRSGTQLQVFSAPGSNGNPPQVTVYFIKDNILCGIDDRAEAEALLQRFAGNTNDNLKSVTAYVAIMDRCRREAKNLEPEARWFAEPFGFIEAARTLRKSTSTRKTDLDYIKIFREQGFDAIQGIGGFVNQLAEGHVELLHRTVVYAPPVKGRENDRLRWNKSMRMLQTPNVAGFEPQSFVPRMTATYITLQLKLTDAFDNVGPIVDALQDHEGAWENSLDGWKNDPYGARVDVRKEFIENMADRITILTGYDTPISVSSERSLFAVETKNEAAVAKALEKLMTKEPKIERRQLGEYVVWERVPSKIEELSVDIPGLELEGASEEEKKEEEKERERVLPNSAMTVALGHLMMASDIDYLAEILEGFGQRERLASSPDYQQVKGTLTKLAPGDHCAWHFGRSDEEFRPTFELIRQGKMPEAKTMLGKFLNNVLRTEQEIEDGVVREQKIDGSTLPNFESVRRYFGPYGRITRADRDGWFITGALLNKEAP